MWPLCNAFNKAGFCQEIDFKRSECLDCSIRYTNHSSIFGMNTTDIAQSWYSSRNAINQGCQGLKGQSLLCIKDCLSQFREITRLVGTCIHSACYFGPLVLYRIHIRRHCWAFNVFGHLSFHENDQCASSVRPGVVILVHKSMPKCYNSKCQ